MSGADSAPLPTTLVLGGARSGKSVHAERLVLASGRAPLYVATATAGDGEMSERIAHHRDRRGPDWATIEEPLALVEILAAEARPDRAILVDCLTLWLSNLLFAERDLDAETARLCAALPSLDGPVVFVSNEIGLGLVPETSLGRRFRDAQGRLNQAVAAVVPSVVFVAAGLPLVLKAPALASPLHHASHGPPPPMGEETRRPPFRKTPLAESPLPKGEGDHPKGGGEGIAASRLPSGDPN